MSVPAGKATGENPLSSPTRGRPGEEEERGTQGSGKGLFLQHYPQLTGGAFLRAGNRGRPRSHPRNPALSTQPGAPAWPEAVRVMGAAGGAADGEEVTKTSGPLLPETHTHSVMHWQTPNTSLPVPPTSPLPRNWHQQRALGNTPRSQEQAGAGAEAPFLTRHQEKA